MGIEQVRLIQQALKDAHIYDNELPDKAVHKLTYLVQKYANEQGIEVSVPYFWYRYGVLTQEPTLSPSPSVPSIEQDRLDSKIQPFIESALDKYYDTSLEEITDISYEDAPYDVFNEWRKLDKQLATLHPEKPDFFDDPPSREAVEESIERVFDSFPVEEYPEHESDLLNWYFALTTELDMGMSDKERMFEINTLFWGIFTLSVARNHHHNMTEDDLMVSLGISSFEQEIEERRSEMRELEREGLTDRYEDRDDELDETTDAIVSPLLQTS